MYISGGNTLDLPEPVPLNNNAILSPTLSNLALYARHIALIGESLYNLLSSSVKSLEDKPSGISNIPGIISVGNPICNVIYMFI